MATALGVTAWGFGGEDLRFAGLGAVLLAVGIAARIPHSIPRVLGRKTWITGGPLPPMALLALLCASTIPHASNVFLCLDTSLYVLLLILLVLVLTHEDRTVRWHIVALCCLVVSAVAIYGFAQLAGVLPSGFWHNGQFAARFVNSAHFGAMAAAASLLGCGAAVSCRAFPWQFTAAATVPVNFAAMLLTPSRAVWLIAAAIWVALGLVVLFHVLAMPGRRRARGVLLLLFACALAASAVAAAWPSILMRFRQLQESNACGLTQRLQVWQVAARIITHHPLGVGAGCFGEEFLRYKLTPDRYVAIRAHNEPLQVVAELGWLSAPAVVWFVAGLAIAAIGVKGDASSSRRRIAERFVFGALALYMLHSLVDFPLRLKANALLFAVSLAVVTPSGARRRTRLRPAGSRLPAQTVAVGLCVAIAVWNGAVAVAYAHILEARQALDRLDFDRAMGRLQQARRWMPLEPRVAFERGRILYLLAGGQPATRRAATLSTALAELDLAIRLAGSRAMHHVRRAWVLEALGQFQEAEISLRHATAADPTLGRFHAYLADFLVDRGRTGEAAEAYRAALEAFHDSPHIRLDVFLDRLSRAGADLRILHLATPADPLSRETLRRYLARLERRE